MVGAGGVEGLEQIASDSLGSAVSLSPVHAEFSFAEADRLGRHQLVLPLGQGGMGTIHLALAGGLGEFRKLLVVKELRRDLVTDQRFIDMFFNEVKLAARLSHPNIVQTIEAGQQGERYYLAMEFLDGQPLSALLGSAGHGTPVPVELRLRILSEALAGLHYAHELKEFDGSALSVVHRDVSPQNIFVTYDGQVKVVDFGIAAVNDTMTSPGTFKGKLSYAAPEQLRGDMIDARTDVFAMGVVMWETLTLRRFARNAIDASAIRARLLGQEPRIGQLDSDIDPHLAAICDRALEVEPDDRFASADEFREAIEDYLSSSSVRADGASIRSMMTEKFAVQREDLHRRINEHLQGVSAASATAEARNAGNQQTLVADLSKYVQDNRQTVVSYLDPAMLDAGYRRRQRMWAIGGGGAAMSVLFAALSLFGFRDEPVAQPIVPVQPAVVAASVASPVALGVGNGSVVARPAAIELDPKDIPAVRRDPDTSASVALTATAGETQRPVRQARTVQAAHLRKRRVERRVERRAELRVERQAVDEVEPVAIEKNVESAVPTLDGRSQAAKQAGSRASAGIALGEDLNGIRGGQVVRMIDTDL